MLRIMLDTNILISALYFPSATTFQFFSILYGRGEVVLSDYVIAELHRVSQKKFPQKAFVVERFLETFPFTLIETPMEDSSKAIPDMRDAQDVPVLSAAIENNVDVLVSGDKDFLVLDIPSPRIMTMADFIGAYA